LTRQQENYKNGGKFISDGDLRKELTQLKKTEEFNWLNNYSNNITKQSIKDACLAYQRFFKHQADFPKFKSKRKSRPSFYVDNCKIEFSENKVKLEKIADSTRKIVQKQTGLSLLKRIEFL
jgi:Probable transposase.